MLHLIKRFAIITFARCGKNKYRMRLYPNICFEEREKRFKKDVDKSSKLRYTKRVAAENTTAKHIDK